MSYIVKVRFPGEQHWITDFVTPDNPLVQELARSRLLALSPVEFCTHWVWQNIHYPAGVVYDYHKIEAFRLGGLFQHPAIKLSAADFWQFPAETLGWRDGWGQRWGDCEDSSTLLCSLLRNWLPPTDVHVALGNMSIFPHAWVEVQRVSAWEIIETTRAHTIGKIDERPYKLKAYFNDKVAVELELGFFSRL